MGKLILVPTPLGNLEDITLRALNVLKSADLVLAEDTRTSSRLFQEYDVSTPLQSFHMHNEHKVFEKYVDQLTSQDITIALISDAGTPGISDPGFLLVRACVQADVEIECLPGPTAIIPALVASGLPCDRFYFEGFLPHKKGRQTRIKFLASLECTVVLYESPHRIIKTLTQWLELIDDRPAVVVREISKIHETYHRGLVSELKSYFEKTPPKGEIVLVISGS